jgi:hypothetical protein
MNNKVKYGVNNMVKYGAAMYTRKEDGQWMQGFYPVTRGSATSTHLEKLWMKQNNIGPEVGMAGDPEAGCPRTTDAPWLKLPLTRQEIESAIDMGFENYDFYIEKSVEAVVQLLEERGIVVCDAGDQEDRNL